MLRSKSKLATLFAGVLVCAVAFAQPLPIAKRPEDAGFSSERLERTRQALKSDVEGKRIPGAVLILVRNGKIVTFDAIGYQVRAGQTPMKKDAIFRVASMSKPITTVAAMIRELAETYPDQASVIGEDVRQTLRKLAELGLVDQGPEAL